MTDSLEEDKPQWIGLCFVCRESIYSHLQPETPLIGVLGDPDWLELSSWFFSLV